MAVGATAGSKLYIAPPGASPSPDTFVEIGEINDLGSIGLSYNQVTAISIGNRNERIFKGTRPAIQYQIKLNRDPYDSGQAMLKTAEASDEFYNFKLVLNDATGGLTTPTTSTFEALVMSYPIEMNGPDTIVGATVTIAVDPATFDEVAAH
jgi:hypothetical protein